MKQRIGMRYWIEHEHWTETGEVRIKVWNREQSLDKETGLFLSTKLNIDLQTMKIRS